MRIFLLRPDLDRVLFYSEDEEPITSTPRGGRVARLFERLRRVMVDYESKLGPRMLRFWEWLQNRAFPDEALLRRLRTAPFLEIHHSTGLSGEQASEYWSSYLQSRRRRHLLWMALDFVLGIVTIVLAPLPGPNVVQYWFLYRFACHLHAVRGLRRAIAKGASTTFFASSILDESDRAGGSFADVAEQLGFHRLDSFLEQSGSKRPSASDTDVAPDTETVAERCAS